MAILSTAFSIVRRLLVAAAVVASMGSAPVAAVDGGGATRAHQAENAAAHACCVPERAALGGLICTQTGCGWTLPAAMGWPVPADWQASWRMGVTILPDDIVPEMVLPPPRA